MKKIITAVLASILFAGALVGLSAAPAAASHEPIAGCTFGETYDIPPFFGMHWHSMLQFHYSDRFRTSAGTCPNDAVRFYSEGWRTLPGSCGRVTIRTFNNDGTTRRLWPAQNICAGTTAVFSNVDNRRLFRFEWHRDGQDYQSSPPMGSWNY